jgi:hypothetical protein
VGGNLHYFIGQNTKETRSCTSQKMQNPRPLSVRNESESRSLETYSYAAPTADDV